MNVESQPESDVGEDQTLDSGNHSTHHSSPRSRAPKDKVATSLGSPPSSFAYLGFQYVMIWLYQEGTPYNPTLRSSRPPPMFDIRQPIRPTSDGDFSQTS